MNSVNARNTNNTPLKKTLTLIEVIAIVIYFSGYTVIALAMVTVTLAIRLVTGLKSRTSEQSRGTENVINGILLVVAVFFLIRSI